MYAGKGKIYQSLSVYNIEFRCEEKEMLYLVVDSTEEKNPISSAEIMFKIESG